MDLNTQSEFYAVWTLDKWIMRWFSSKDFTLIEVAKCVRCTHNDIYTMDWTNTANDNTIFVMKNVQHDEAKVLCYTAYLTVIVLKERSGPEKRETNRIRNNNEWMKRIHQIILSKYNYCPPLLIFHRSSVCVRHDTDRKNKYPEH